MGNNPTANLQTAPRRRSREPTIRHTHDARNEIICLGGLPPIVVAATEGDLETVIGLVDDLDSVLHESEKAIILEAARSGDVQRTQEVIRDLFTRQTQRKHFVDSMIAEDVDLAKMRLKEMYFKPAGAYSGGGRGAKVTRNNVGRDNASRDNAKEKPTKDR